MRSAMSFITACAAASLTAAAAGGNICPGDLNGDGATNVTDLLLLLGDYACTGSCAGDANNDGATNVTDLLLLLGDYGCVVNTGPSTTLSGTVTNLWTGTGIAGASVTVGEETILANAFGAYSGEFSAGLYDVLIEAENF